MRMGKSPGLKLQASIVQDNVPVEVAPGLFVGSIHAAFNVDALKERKISHILNLAGASATFPHDFTYLSVSIRDKDYANLLSCLPVCALFLQAGVDAGGVLVHCAGGRSRSPAVAIAYLMTTDKRSFDAAVEHVRTLRPVVALNAGFEAQLRCLERASGDVFVAHQLHLQRKLTNLTQRRIDDSLAREAQRRQHRVAQSQHSHSQQTVPGTPPHPSMSLRVCQAASCDDRGMLAGSVPSGFALSLPLTAERATFVPALRSMGSLFGCRACGEHLFCASAVVQHNAATHWRSDGVSTTSSMTSKPPMTTRGKARHDPWSFDDEPTADAANGSAISPQTAEAVSTDPSMATLQPPLPPPPLPLANDVDAPSTKKTPLLAKLRLRPQSPSVSSPTGSDKSTPRASSSPAAAASASSSAAPSPISSSGVLKKSHKTTDKPKRVDKDDAVTTGDRTSDKFWRTLTALAVTTRRFKDTSSSKDKDKDKDQDKHRHTAAGGDTSSSDKKAHTTSQYEPPLVLNATALRENAVAWDVGLHALERASFDTTAARSRVAALVAADAKALAAFTCDEWFIEPQTWFIDAMQAAPAGAIACPNSACNAVVGHWHWDGLSCSCGGRVCPGIQMTKAALQPLGNVVTPPMRRAATNDGAPPHDVTTALNRQQ